MAYLAIRMRMDLVASRQHIAVCIRGEELAMAARADYSWHACS